MKPKSLRGKALRALEILSPILPDKAFISLKFRLMIGSWPHLKHPRTFNEKLQHFKLYDRNPLYTKLVDKAAVKDYVRAKLAIDPASDLAASASEFADPDALTSAHASDLAALTSAHASELAAHADDTIIPTLGVWDCFGQIDFASLPTSFVLKCTHDSGSAVIVRDKDAFLRSASAEPASELSDPSSELTAARTKLTAALSRDYSLANREWPYHDVPRRIIAEPYLADLDGVTDDYKFFCRDGSVRFLFVATGRIGGDSATRFDFFDPSWNHLPLTNGHPCADTIPARPANFDDMLALAAKLSQGLPFVRVDLYNINGRILFGEYTFSHWGGFKPFDPPTWDLRLGQLLD